MTKHMTAFEALATCSRLHSYERNPKSCGVYIPSGCRKEPCESLKICVCPIVQREEIMVENSKCASQCYRIP